MKSYWEEMATCAWRLMGAGFIHGIEDWFRGDSEDWNDSYCFGRLVVCKFTYSFEMMFGCIYLVLVPSTY